MNIGKYDGLDELTEKERSEIILLCLAALTRFFAEQFHMSQADIEYVGELNHSTFTYFLTGRPGSQASTLIKTISGCSIYPDEYFLLLREVFEQLYGIPTNHLKPKASLEDYPELAQTFQEIIQAKLNSK